MLAEVYSQFSSNISLEEHQQVHGDAQRRVFYPEGEGRAQLVSLVEKVKSQGLRVVRKELYELYCSWDAMSEEVDGYKGFKCCIVPKKTYDDLRPEKDKQVELFFHENLNETSLPNGVWEALYTIQELAPNVCELTLLAKVSPGRIRSTFAKVESLQAAFRRNGKEVDEEIRNGLAAIIESSSARHNLNEDQLNFVNEVKKTMRATAKETGEYGWIKVNSPSPFVEMSRTHSDKMKVALSSAKTIIDRRPAQVIA